jgi:molecular chaperone GrpE
MTQTPTRPEPADAAATDETKIDTATDAVQADSQTPDLGAVIAAIEAEKTELKDKVLRTLAEMENLRRRTDREVADARTYGVTGFARDMLTVADNVRRALETIPEELRASSEGPIKALLEGIELTERDLLKTLERHGVRKLDPTGQKFDPNLHQAMFEVEDPNMPNGTVVQVVQSGFVIGDRVLRPALVGVSKGGPKPAAANGSAEAAAKTSET